MDGTVGSEQGSRAQGRQRAEERDVEPKLTLGSVPESGLS